MGSKRCEIWDKIIKYLIFFNINPKTTNCVWTAPAWPDCMCVLPAEHMFSCCFSVFVHDFSYCRSVLTPHRKSGKNVHKRTPTWGPKKCFFVRFERSRSKGAPGWSQGPPQGVKSESKGPQRCPRVVPRTPQGAKSEAKGCPRVVPRTPPGRQKWAQSPKVPRVVPRSPPGRQKWAQRSQQGIQKLSKIVKPKTCLEWIAFVWLWVGSHHCKQTQRIYVLVLIIANKPR